MADRFDDMARNLICGVGLDPPCPHRPHEIAECSPCKANRVADTLRKIDAEAERRGRLLGAQEYRIEHSTAEALEVAERIRENIWAKAGKVGIGVMDQDTAHDLQSFAAEAVAEERLAHANQLQADIEAEQQGRLALRKRLGARDDETMGAFLERLATMAGVVPADVHERGWQWRPTGDDTAFAPPFGTVRICRVCGCLVAGGPTACVRCAEAGA